MFLFIVYSKEGYIFFVNIFLHLHTTFHNFKMHALSYFNISEIKMYLNTDGVLKSQLARQWMWYSYHCVFILSSLQMSYMHCLHFMYWNCYSKCLNDYNMIYLWVINYDVCRNAWKERNLRHNKKIQMRQIQKSASIVLASFLPH